MSTGREWVEAVKVLLWQEGHAIVGLRGTGGVSTHTLERLHTRTNHM